MVKRAAFLTDAPTVRAAGPLILVAVVGVLLMSLKERNALTKPAAAPAARTTPAPDAVPAEEAEPLVELAKRGASVRGQRRALRAFLREHDVGRASTATVLRHTRDGIMLWPGRKSSSSRLGGTALLPRGVPWPENGSGKPFSFIGAFDLGDLPHVEPLPDRGTLAFYWDFHWIDEPGDMDFVAATRVYFLEPGAAADHPEPPREAYPFDEIPLRGTRTAVAGDPFLVAEAIEGRPDDGKVLAAMNALMQAGFFTHRLLGAPNEIQGPVLDGMPFFFDPKRKYLTDESRERFTPAEREHGEWVLLAQIEEGAGLVIADGGILHFVILRSDLEARRFDRVIGMMESH